MAMTFSDLAGIPNPYDGQPQPGPTEPNYEQANNKMDEGIDTIRPQQPPDAAILKMTTTTDPKTGKQVHDVKLTDALYQEVQRLAGMGAQAESAFTQARQALEQKRDFLNAHPIIAGVGRIASAAAAEYAGGPRGARISPLVHAAGAYGLDTYGQSPDALNGQIAGLSQQAMQAQIPYANLLEKGVAAEQADADRDEARAQRLDLAKERLTEKKALRLQSLSDNYFNEAKSFHFDPRDPNSMALAKQAADAFEAHYIAEGGSKEEAATDRKRGEAIATLAGAAFTSNQDRLNKNEKDNIRLRELAIANATNRVQQMQKTKDQQAAFKSIDIQADKKKDVINAIGSLSLLSKSLSSMEDKLNALNGQGIGPGAGQLTKLSELFGTNTPEGAAAFHDTKQLLLQQGALYNPGVSGNPLLRKYGLKAVQDLKPDLTMNRGQIEGLVGAIRETMGNAFEVQSAKLNKAQVQARRALYPDQPTYNRALTVAIDPQKETPIDLGKVDGINPQSWYPADANVPQGPKQPPGAAPSATALPDTITKQLKDGVATKLNDGSVWTKKNGQAVRVQ